MRIMVLLLFLLVLYPASATAQNNRYIIDGQNNALRMRPRNDYDPTHVYRGQRNENGDTRLRNPYTGDRLRGQIDERGYGRLRDQDGNLYRVRPR